VGILVTCFRFGFDSTGLGIGTGTVKISNKSIVKKKFKTIFVKDE
jgi:hypothetical protein